MSDDSDERARARVGTEIKQKYRLERLIGSGGMASVYEAEHRNGHRVAIKLLHPHVAVNGDLRSRFLREGYVANKVKHRGAVRVIDDDTDGDGSVFLVMELLVGESLEARLQRSGGKLAHGEVCELAHQLLDVLSAAHGAGIVHRDIKPDNVFLTQEGVLKVLDFGIARLQEASGAQGVTRTGSTIGTPAFMPPEQALGRSRQIDAQTDLWSVAATMFTLMSGHYVHEAETLQEMLVFAASHPARSLGAVAPEVPAGIVAVVDRGLAFGKEMRWPDARSMQDALTDACRVAYGVTLSTSQALSRSSPFSPLPSQPARTGEPSQGGVGPTVHDPSMRASGPVAPTALEQTTGSGTQVATTAGPQAIAISYGVASGPPAVRGMSTTAGIAGPAAITGGIAEASPPPRPRSILPWVGLSGGLAVALAGVLAFVLNQKSGPAPTTVASAPVTPPPAHVALGPPSSITPTASPDPRATAAVRREPYAPPAPGHVATPEPTFVVPVPRAAAPPAQPAQPAAPPAQPAAPPAPPLAPPVPVAAPPETSPPALTCYADPFTGKVRLAPGGQTPSGEARFPCKQDPFTGGYVRDGKLR